MRKSRRAERASAIPVTKLSRKRFASVFDPDWLAFGKSSDQRLEPDLPPVDFLNAKGVQEPLSERAFRELVRRPVALAFPHQRIDVVEGVVHRPLVEAVERFPFWEEVSHYAVVPFAVGFVVGSHRPGVESVDLALRRGGLYLVERREFRAVVGYAGLEGVGVSCDDLMAKKRKYYQLYTGSTKELED